MSGCVRITTQKKYTSRPSPPYPANECDDEPKQGNDGRMYRAVPNSKGIRQWKPLKTSGDGEMPRGRSRRRGDSQKREISTPRKVPIRALVSIEMLAGDKMTDVKWSKMSLTKRQHYEQYLLAIEQDEIQSYFIGSANFHGTFVMTECRIKATHTKRPFLEIAGNYIDAGMTYEQLTVMVYGIFDHYRTAGDNQFKLVHLSSSDF